MLTCILVSSLGFLWGAQIALILYDLGTSILDRLIIVVIQRLYILLLRDII